MAYRDVGIRLIIAAHSPGYSEGLHHKILEVYFAGLTAGTWRYKAAQAQRYTRYAKSAGFNHLEPDQYNILAYTIHLLEELAARGTVLNYLSGA